MYSLSAFLTLWNNLHLSLTSTKYHLLSTYCIYYRHHATQFHKNLRQGLLLLLPHFTDEEVEPKTRGGVYSKLTSDQQPSQNFSQVCQTTLPLKGGCVHAYLTQPMLDPHDM